MKRSEMTDEQLNAELAKKKAVHKELYDAYKAAQDAMAKAWKGIEGLQQEQARREIKNNDLVSVLQRVNAGTVPYSKEYTDAQKLIRDSMKAYVPGDSFFEWDRWHVGETDTTYLTPKLTPRYGADAKAWSEGLWKLLDAWDKVFSYPDEIVLDIMDNDLAKSGIITLVVNMKTRESRVAKTSYGRPRTLKEGTLEETLTYLSKNHWYGEPYPNSEDSEW
jgi:hypothetical protein